ncbi:MAG: acyltransferase family protein, partial [Gemmatimonadota bacterium]
MPSSRFAPQHVASDQQLVPAASSIKAHRTPYRPEIDGLRAIAVIGVILFHLGVPHVQGGFAGVDVFFVISGFLITGNLLTDMQAGRFSFARFYERRARRLLPALFFTLAASMAASAILLPPYQLRAMAKSLAAAVFSASNFVFWSQSGYFDTDAALKPLLHTWSLSVEEQFYLLWPTLMLLLWKRGGARLLITVLALAVIVSTGAAEFVLSRDRDAAFYLAPFRVAELAIGALCVWWIERIPSGWWKGDLTAFVGLAAIGYAIISFTDHTRFPGINALLPCLGTAAVICAPDARLARSVLSVPIARGIGLISYSLYLAHWPILVFVRHRTEGPFGPWLGGALLVAMFAVATLMYFYVERPFRWTAHRPTAEVRVSGANVAQGTRRFVTGLAVAAAALTLLAYSAYATRGWPARVAPDVRLLLAGNAEAFQRRAVAVRSPRCHMNGAFDPRRMARPDCMGIMPDRLNVLVIGDSHAADLWMALHGAYPEVNFLQATGAGCLPVEARYAGLERPCLDLLRYVKRSRPTLDGIDGVILAGRWRPPLEEIRTEIDFFESQHIPVTVFGPPLELSDDVRTLLFRAGSASDFEAFAQQFVDSSVVEVDRQLQRVVAAEGAGYVSIIGMLCGRGTCPMFDANRRLLLHDYGHWGVEGGAYFARLLTSRYPDPNSLLPRPHAARPSGTPL